MPILGTVASSMQSGLATGFYSIATTTLTSTAASITFSSIPNTYKHLQIRMVLKSTRNATGADCYAQFNGDTSSNYFDNKTISVEDLGLYSFSTASSTGAYIGHASATAGNTSFFGGAVVDIYDYNATFKYKTTHMRGTLIDIGKRVFIQSGASTWKSTAAITSITLGTINDFATSTTVSLYGIV